MPLPESAPHSEVLSGGGPDEGGRGLPPWLRRTGLAVAALAVLAVAGRPLLGLDEESGRDQRQDQSQDRPGENRVSETAGPVLPQEPRLGDRYRPPARAWAPEPAAADGGPPLRLVGRVGDPSRLARYRYVQVRGRELTPLNVPGDTVVPSDDGRTLFVPVDGDRVYAVPVPGVPGRPAAARYLGRGAVVLGARANRVFTTPAVAAGSPVQLLSGTDGTLLDRRYVQPPAGMAAVGIVDSGEIQAVVLRAGPAGSGPARLSLRWPDGAEVPLTRGGRFLGARGGVAVVAPAPAECGYPPRRCLLVVRPGPFQDLRGGTVYAPYGWRPEPAGPVGFAGGGVVFPVRDVRGDRALAVAWPSSVRARLVPGSLGAAPEHGLTTDGSRLFWAVDDPGLGVTAVSWQAGRPAEPARHAGMVLPAGFRFVCGCG